MPNNKQAQFKYNKKFLCIPKNMYSSEKDFIESKNRKQNGNLSTIACGFLLVNAALGIGIFNYPQLYDRIGGIAAATIIQILAIVLILGSVIALVYCAELTACDTYHDVLNSMVGPRTKTLSAFTVCVILYGIGITLLIIIGDQYDRLFMLFFGPDFCETFYLNRHFTISVTSVVFILPMCYAKTLEFLKYISSLGIVAMLYPVFLVVHAFFIQTRSETVTIKTRPDNIWQPLIYLPVICFAYEAQQVAVPIYAKLKNRCVTNFAKAAIFQMLSLFVVYSVTGIMGYLTFGSAVRADVMQMLDVTSPWVLVGIGIVVIRQITGFPMIVICGREALLGLYYSLLPASSKKEIVALQTHTQNSSTPESTTQRIVLTTVWFFTSVFLACFVPSIGVAIELLGALACLNIFVFPGLCLINLFRKRYHFQQRFPGLMLAFGLLLLAVGIPVLITLLTHDIDAIIHMHNSHQLLCNKSYW